jgi:hypothetical protein
MYIHVDTNNKCVHKVMPYCKNGISMTTTAIFTLLFSSTNSAARWYVFKPKIQFGKILESLGMGKVGILFGHWEYFTTIWYILLPFGTLVANLVYSPPLLVYCVKKNLATLSTKS